jgi:hypothetical protein
VSSVFFSSVYSGKREKQKRARGKVMREDYFPLFYGKPLVNFTTYLHIFSVVSPVRRRIEEQKK